MSKFWKKLRENDCYMDEEASTDNVGDGCVHGGIAKNKAAGKKRKTGAVEGGEEGGQPSKKARGIKPTKPKQVKEENTASE